MEQQVRQLERNLQLMGIASEVLKSLIEEKKRIGKDTHYYEIFDLVAAHRVLHRRIEKEARTLASLQRKDLSPPTPPPEFPPRPKDLPPEKIFESDFYKTVWGANRK